MILKGLMASIVINGILGGLWLHTRDQLASSVVQCNADKLQSVAQAEQSTRLLVQQTAAERIAQMAGRLQATELALASYAEVIRQAAQKNKADEARIHELELEAFDEDELPDSAACLNVYLPARVLYTGNCGETGTGGNHQGKICAGSEVLNPTDPSFASITYGDAMRLWSRDRRTIRTLNEQLKQLESLQPD